MEGSSCTSISGCVRAGVGIQNVSCYGVVIQQVVGSCSDYFLQHKGSHQWTCWFLNQPGHIMYYISQSSVTHTLWGNKP